MSWKIVRRKLGRAGGFKQRTARQKEWDQKYGEGNWAIGYIIDKIFIDQEKAICSIYNKSYREYLDAHPQDVAFLAKTAKKLRNPHAAATTSVDLQVPAIMEYLQNKNISLSGTKIVDIGSWQGNYSHPISIRLSPLQIQVTGNPKMTLEKFWQSRKCLAVWQENLERE